MFKLLLSVGCALALLTTATVSDAKIFVNISDGTTAGTLDARASTVVPFVKGGLRLSLASPAPTGTTDVTVVHNILSCTTRPCKVYFPSGNVHPAAPLTTDTFILEDVSSPALSPARVEKFDSGASADRVSFKGVKITSRTAGKTLVITYGTQTNDLRSITSTSQSYTGTAALTGTFKTSTGLKATGCNPGLTAADVGVSCVKLSVALNGTTVNGAGGSAVATVSVPCSNSTTGSPSPASVNPCGTNGSYTSALGSFTGVNDSTSLSCLNSCLPTQVGTVTAKFTGANEVLQLTASANGGMSNVGDSEGGIEEVFLTLADEVGVNRWVSFTAVNELCIFVPKAPTTNDTRNVTNKSTLPINGEQWCGKLSTAVNGIDLVSIIDPAEGELAGSSIARNDASRVGFLPAQGQLQLKLISALSLNYDVIVGSSPSGNNTLGDLNFKDCIDGSFRVEFEVRDNQDKPAGIVKVYLGNDDQTQYKNNCVEFDPATSVDLVANPNARVDISGLTGNLASTVPITFTQLKQGPLGNLRVRKMSVVVDHGQDTVTQPRGTVGTGDNDATHVKLDAGASGTDDFYNGMVIQLAVGVNPLQYRTITDYVGSTKIATVGAAWTNNPVDATSTFVVNPSNHKVVFKDGTIVTPAGTFSAADSLQVVTGPLTRVTDLSTNGVSFVIQKLTGQNPGIVKVIRGANIEISGGKYTTSVKLADISPESGKEYTVSLCINGAEETSAPANVPVGICIPDQAFFTLQ